MRDCVRARARPDFKIAWFRSEKSENFLCVFSHFIFLLHSVHFSQRVAARDRIKTLLFLNFGGFWEFHFVSAVVWFVLAIRAPPHRSFVLFPLRGCAFVTLLLEFFIIMILKAFSNERNRFFGCEITTSSSQTRTAMTKQKCKYINKCRPNVEEQQPELPNHAANSKRKKKSVHFVAEIRMYVVVLAVSSYSEFERNFRRK